MCIKKFEEKVSGEEEECIFDIKKCKTFQGPKADPGLWPIFALFTHLTPLCYISIISEKNSGAPLDQILDPLVDIS